MATAPLEVRREEDARSRPAGAGRTRRAYAAGRHGFSPAVRPSTDRREPGSLPSRRGGSAPCRVRVAPHPVALTAALAAGLAPQAAAAVRPRPRQRLRPAGLWTAPLAGDAPRDPALRPAGQSDYGAGHRGVDLAGRPGQQVLAAGAGVVLFAGMVAGRPVISVVHADGLRTTYEPVDPSVAAGQEVARGSPIGTLTAGHAGCPAAACLHWGLLRGTGYLDPLALLRPVQVRLLPMRTQLVPDA